LTRQFDRPQLFYLNTEVVVKQGLVYFDGGIKLSFYCIFRDCWKILRDCFGLTKYFWTIHNAPRRYGCRTCFAFRTNCAAL